jgi:hypothetical protein
MARKKVRWSDWYREFSALAHQAGIPPEEYEGSTRQGDEYVATLFRDGETPQNAIEFVRDRQARRARGHGKGTVMARKQQHLPGIEPGVGHLEIVIPVMPMWEQVGGDMSPGAYGAILAKSDGHSIELLEIQPVREHVGDGEAKDIGFPFWSKEAYFDLDDLNPKSDDVQSALQSIGMELSTLEDDFTPEQRAMVIAEALLGWGRGDEGEGGWSKDVVPEQVKWWGGKIAGPEYLADDDESFKDDVLGYGDIKTALEEEVERLADMSSAEAWSTAGDQMASDLEDEGFDPESIVIEAEFGDAIAVNGDPLVGPHWAEVLGAKHNDLWSEFGTSELTDWLDKNGYDYLDKAGGRVPSEEGFAQGETAVYAVAEELELPRERVEEAAESLDWWQEEIPRGTSGHTHVWAKRKEGTKTEEARRRARRR